MIGFARESYKDGGGGSSGKYVSPYRRAGRRQTPLGDPFFSRPVDDDGCGAETRCWFYF